VRIQTTGYPTQVAIPGWNQGDTYFHVNITGGVGRRLRYVDTTCDVGGFFDNLAFGISSSGSPGGYVQNGTEQTGSIGPFDGIPSSPWWFGIGFGPGGFSPGAFLMDVEIETGLATNEWVLLAESGVAYSVETLGTPNIEAEGGPEPPAQCFWTDQVRVTQTGCEPAP
jgi:hypothetical protein